jgi:2'-5' RNA ligase
MNKENLYFIALVPDIQLRENIKKIKQEVCEKYNSCHALKSPAHITLQKPFKRTGDEEQTIIHAIRQTANIQEPFEISLTGYGTFPPKVIYINAQPVDFIGQLHSNLKNHLIEGAHFTDKELSHKIMPHITIAHRDLKPDMFKKAWGEFKNFPFEAKFKAKSIFLLKHNGKNWDINRELKFKH